MLVSPQGVEPRQRRHICTRGALDRVSRPIGQNGAVWTTRKSRTGAHVDVLAAYGYPVRAARIASRLRIRSTSAIPSMPLVTMNSIGVRRENGAAWILRCSHA
jgi:hypothetical protein